MQRRTSSQASTIVIFLSILTILVQFITYQFFDTMIIIWGISTLISIIGCHILLEQTGTYRTCFDYSFLTLFISSVIIGLTWQGNTETLLPYTETMLGIAIINWLIPMIHCFFRSMIGYGTKADDFSSFFLGSTIVFLIVYSVVIVYSFFLSNAYPFKIGTSLIPVFSPFDILSGQIEDYLNGNLVLGTIITYLASRVLIYIPYGFYLRLILRRQKRLIRFGMLLVLPFIISTLQYFIVPSRCNLDDIIYGFLGSCLGCFIFFLTNTIFRAFSGRDFLSQGSDYRSYSSQLHF